ILLQGSHKLKDMNLSRTSLIKGRFLRFIFCLKTKRFVNFPLEKLKDERPNVKLVPLVCSERLLRGISYASSDDEDAWIVNDDEMEDFIVDQEDFL
ncbi:unnamed protein product, partial [Brassica oleracea var. botrytis]